MMESRDYAEERYRQMMESRDNEEERYKYMTEVDRYRYCIDGRREGIENGDERCRQMMKEGKRDTDR